MQATDFEELFTPRDFLRYAVTNFETAKIALGQGCTTLLDEAVYLIAGVLKLPNESMDYFWDARLLRTERKALQAAIFQRCAHVPTAYITGTAFLAGYQFCAEKGAIIPRSFIAELLEERLEPWLADPDADLKILDLCTGQGSLAIIAAHNFPRAHIDAVDISSDALKIAQKNVDFYNLNAQISLILGDSFSAVENKKYDVILCNPPYVADLAMATLPPEFHVEPRLALSGGADGLDFVRPLLQNAQKHLAAGGILIVEIGHNKAALESAFPNLPFIWLETAGFDDYVFLLNAQDF